MVTATPVHPVSERNTALETVDETPYAKVEPEVLRIELITGSGNIWTHEVLVETQDFTLADRVRELVCPVSKPKTSSRPVIVAEVYPEEHEKAVAGETRNGMRSQPLSPLQRFDSLTDASQALGVSLPQLTTPLSKARRLPMDDPRWARVKVRGVELMYVSDWETTIRVND